MGFVIVGVYAVLADFPVLAPAWVVSGAVQGFDDERHGLAVADDLKAFTKSEKYTRGRMCRSLMTSKQWLPSVWTANENIGRA